jgi:Tfp pilus assembly protein PilF
MACWALWFYLAKAVVPTRLCMLYPWPDTARQVLAVPLLAATVALLVALRRRPWGAAVGLGLGVFAVSLVPVLGFADISLMRFTPVADHWQYAALPAVTGLACGLVGAWARQRAGQWPRRATVLGGGLVLVLAVATAQRVQAFSSPEALWRNNLEHNPLAWQAHAGLADVLAARGDAAGAARHYQAALALESNAEEVHYNYGRLLFMTGRPDEARLHYEQAARIYPRHTGAHNNLGILHLGQGRPADAAACFVAAVESRPDFLEGYVNLAAALAACGRFAEAQRAAIQGAERALAARRGDLATLLHGAARDYAAAADAARLARDPAPPPQESAPP